MKARVKATGEIVEVRERYEPEEFTDVNDGTYYDIEELELFYEPDYWETLKHHYAGMAMQAMLGNPDITASVDANAILSEYVVGNAVYYATALVEKLKNDSK